MPPQSAVNTSFREARVHEEGRGLRASALSIGRAVRDLPRFGVADSLPCLLLDDHTSAAADHLRARVYVALVAACPTADPVVGVAVVHVDQVVALAAVDEVSVGPVFVGAHLVTATLEMYLVV